MTKQICSRRKKKKKREKQKQPHIVDIGRDKIRKYFVFFNILLIQDIQDISSKYCCDTVVIVV